MKNTYIKQQVVPRDPLNRIDKERFQIEWRLACCFTQLCVERRWV